MIDVRKLGFIGGGNMAEALIAGLIRQGLPASRIVVSDPSPAQRERLLREHGIAAVTDNGDAARDAEALVLAVKPQHMRDAVHSVAAQLSREAGGARAPLVISVAAGIPHAALSAWLGGAAPVVRAMPNRPALFGFGATGLYAPPEVGPAERALAESVLAAVGMAVWVERESQMDTVTALSGSGPAYFFLFMEALEAAAHARGLPRDVARRLTLETALGAAQMARSSADPLESLREQVTSKGGTTAAALAVLDSADLRGIVAQALTAADRRSAQLAAEFGTH